MLLLEGLAATVLFLSIFFKFGRKPSTHAPGSTLPKGMQTAKFLQIIATGCPVTNAQSTSVPYEDVQRNVAGEELVRLNLLRNETVARKSERSVAPIGAEKKISSRRTYG